MASDSSTLTLAAWKLFQAERLVRQRLIDVASDEQEPMPPHLYVAFVSETLCDHLVAAAEPPPRRSDRRDDSGRAVATAIDVYMDTRVRGLGLWVEDTGFKYFAVKPRRLPAGVVGVHSTSIERGGVMIGAPMWVSKSTRTVLTAERARIEGRRLLSLIPTLTPWEGQLDADGVLDLDYRHPRPPYSTRRAQPSTRPRCAACGR